MLRSSAHETAEYRQQERFGKQLAHDTQATGTERHADANLAFARHAAGQDERPEIGAGRDEQQQHQGRGGQHNLELLAVAVERENRPRLEILTLPDVVGPTLTQAGGEGERLLLRRLRRHSGPETSIEIEGRVPVGEQRAAFDHIRLPDQRHPDVVAVLAERGITPTTRSSLPFTRMLRPMTAGSPPSRRCQNNSPMTAAGSASGRSSSGVSTRPSAGAMPNSGK